MNKLRFGGLSNFDEDTLLVDLDMPDSMSVLSTT